MNYNIKIIDENGKILQFDVNADNFYQASEKASQQEFNNVELNDNKNIQELLSMNKDYREFRSLSFGSFVKEYAVNKINILRKSSEIQDISDPFYNYSYHKIIKDIKKDVYGFSRDR